MRALVARAREAFRALLKGWNGASDVDPTSLHGALCAVLLRVLAAAMGEARALLPPTLAAVRAESDVWGALVRSWAVLHAACGGRLFDAATWPMLDDAAFEDGALRRALDLLLGDGNAASALDVEAVGKLYENLLADVPMRAPEGTWTLRAGDARRRSGSHYTPRAVTDAVARAAMAPLLDASPTIDAVLALRVCDPAMGAGAFLAACARVLDEALRACGADEGARRTAVTRCLHGVDRDATAVELARLALWFEAGDATLRVDAFEDTLRVGDALVGEVGSFDDARAADVAVACVFAGATKHTQRSLEARWQATLARGDHAAAERFVHASMGDTRCFHWALVWPAVFARGGFDLVVGNPPWVSYAGRAAQPLDASRRRWFAQRYASFAGYRNLQGIFLERMARIARPAARVGVVLPSSMAELAGYAPTRAAFDRHAVCDPSLPDLGEESFDDVDQPSMALLGTVRARPLDVGSADPWPLERPDVDDEARALLARLAGPPLPPETFGERGFQTFAGDAADFSTTPDARRTLGLRVGSDVQPFQRGAPSAWADPARITARLRAPDAWMRVDLVIRQTARVPMAARNDGAPFRNTLLAGFATDALGADALLAWLNCTAVRWAHFYRHRDARLGMPQVKIGHLRSIAAPPPSLVPVLATIGAALGARNAGISDDEQRDLDARVADALGLTTSQRERMARDASRWAPRASVRTPAGRG